jgi:hypothetical protein
MLFSRYSVALSKGPWQFFRMRDTDALVRFTIGVALACNDLDHIWFTDDQFDIMAEIGNTMYDGISYWKHRSEGEINSTFAYVPEEKRVLAYHKCREALWALDVAWARQPEMKCVINFLRYFGGPIHMIMRRYRFVEEGLTLGRPEDQRVIAQTRNNFKLWNRIDEQKKTKEQERFSLEHPSACESCCHVGWWWCKLVCHTFYCKTNGSWLTTALDHGVCAIDFD